jgi:hypothetical protein
MLNKINGLRKCAQIVNSLKTLSLGVKYIIPLVSHGEVHSGLSVTKEIAKLITENYWGFGTFTPKITNFYTYIKNRYFLKPL